MAPYSGAESGCHDVPLPSRSIGTARSVAPFIRMSPMRMPSSCCICIGAVDAGAGVPAGADVGADGTGAALAGAVVIPGIGAIVAAGAAVCMPGIAFIGEDATAAPGGRTITKTIPARMVPRGDNDGAGLMTAPRYHTPTPGVYPTQGALTKPEARR
jgi:hypothetical protein